MAASGSSFSIASRKVASLRTEIAYGENEGNDYRVKCHQIGETNKADCQVMPILPSGAPITTYTRTITFDPANPARCIGDSGLIECPAGTP